MISKIHTNELYKNESTHHLAQLGWNSHFQSHLDNLNAAKLVPARVIGVRKNSFNVSDGEKEWLATVAGRLLHQADSLYPVAGDWVLLNDTIISAVLPRQNVLSRGASGSRGKQDVAPAREQMIAANLDSVFIVCGLDRDFNLRRIERYLTLVYNCGLNPVIILTKEDLQPDPGKIVSDVESVAFGTPVHLVSALDSKGLSELDSYLSPGLTIALVGSSGAGKSTLVNRLVGKTIQTTAAISQSVGKGKHTTTTRDLIRLPRGGMMIDNPGIREIAFWDDEGGIESAFPEIEERAAFCRFSDCSHTHEPGCQVLEAVKSGDIREDRLESYHKMNRELTYISQRQQKSADRVEKERWKEVALKVKAIKKRKFK